MLRLTAEPEVVFFLIIEVFLVTVTVAFPRRWLVYLHGCWNQAWVSVLPVSAGLQLSQSRAAIESVKKPASAINVSHKQGGEKMNQYILNVVVYLRCHKYAETKIYTKPHKNRGWSLYSLCSFVSNYLEKLHYWP